MQTCAHHNETRLCAYPEASQEGANCYERKVQELDSMEAQGIISKYDGRAISPEWLNSFVIVKKPNGSLRICLDPIDLNKEIIRPVCNAQTMDDVVHKLKSAKYFAVFDTSKGFFHIPLDAESKVLTAMLTPFGIYVYNVLAMGLSNVTDPYGRYSKG